MAEAVRVALVYGQLLRLTPPRAIGPNLTATLRCVAPFLPFDEPTYDAVSKMQSEMTMLGGDARRTGGS
eukprot:880726-Pleurochrysis_carterae.AAC.1